MTALLFICPMLILAISQIEGYRWMLFIQKIEEGIEEAFGRVERVFKNPKS